MNALPFLARTYFRAWAAKPADERARDARSFALQLQDSGVRSKLAAVAPPAVINAFDRLLMSMGEWHA